jgi:cell filamentation protein
MAEDPYVYPGSDVLINNLEIRDPRQLSVAEADITTVALATLAGEPLPGYYDIAHLQAVHRWIFGDLYPWAGELRTVTIAKDASLFALPEHIAPYLAGVLSDLANEDRLRGLQRADFVDRLAHYFAELKPFTPSARATVAPSAPSLVRSQLRRDTRSTGPAWIPKATLGPRAKAIEATTSCC